jgi:hypothetical protein
VRCSGSKLARQSRSELAGQNDKYLNTMIKIRNEAGAEGFEILYRLVVDRAELIIDTPSGGEKYSSSDHTSGESSHLGHYLNFGSCIDFSNG